MDKFVIKEFVGDIKSELKEIGFDSEYITQAQNKFKYKNIKIFDVTSAQANIIKQTALSFGADCATHRDVITGKADKTDCILGASHSQLKKIVQKLKEQPFHLKILSEQIEYYISDKLTPIVIKDNMFDFSRTYIVGILNLGESFSDGYTDFNSAAEHLEKMISDGADIIDIGAESTKPGSNKVDDDIQIKKILPILDYISSNNIRIPISIDTRSSSVAKICLDKGADIINDVSGLDFDKNMVKVISEFNCPIIIQHSSSTPDIMQNNTNYKNLMDDIYKSLYQKIEFAKENGVDTNKIITDPGIGFGKTREQNIEILNRFEEFFSLNCPIMIGTSRKSFLNMKKEDNTTKDIFTLAINAVLMKKKVNFLRVHNVELHKKLLDSEIL